MEIDQIAPEDQTALPIIEDFDYQKSKLAIKTLFDTWR
jgi:hypothetical protein